MASITFTVNKKEDPTTGYLVVSVDYVIEFSPTAAKLGIVYLVTATFGPTVSIVPNDVDIAPITAVSTPVKGTMRKSFPIKGLTKLGIQYSIQLTPDIPNIGGSGTVPI